MSNVFYFVAQSGVITPQPLRTNFYTYTIPEIRKGEVLAEVEAAKLGEGGLEYPPQFLKDLEAWDKRGKRMAADLPVYTAERLIAKYGSTGQHPEFRLYGWQQAVAENATRLGYWEWVEGKVNG